jgi:hypothetical protein
MIVGNAQSPSLPSSSSGEAAAVLSAAREALGGEKRLAGVKTVVATGRTRQVQGDNLVPIEFEINIEFPDKYVRTDEIPARESGPTSRGFNGDGLIQFPEPPPARAGGPPGRGGEPPNPTVPLKQDFARLTLGMFAASFSSYPLTFGLAGQAEAPEGKADVLDAKGAPNFAARLFIDNKTHLPLMLSWQTPVNGAAPTENRIYYADYRDVDGMKFPFRIRRAIGAVTTEETTFDRFRINSKIDPRKFEVRK